VRLYLHCLPFSVSAAATAPFHIVDLGGSTFASGLFLGFLTYLLGVFSAPFTGAYADRIGHRRMLIISSVALRFRSRRRMPSSPTTG
jgi:MFS family permease